MTTIEIGRETPMSRKDQIWDAESLLARRDWKHRLPDVVAEEFVAFCRANPDAASDPEAFRFDADELPALATFADHIRTDLLDRTGIVWIHGLDRLSLTAAEQRLFYVALGSAMGEPLTNYGLLFPVKDRGKDYKVEAIPVSMTSAETGFHTDSSSVDTLPDLVGLLCENPSTSGGESLVTNALAVHEQLQAAAPAVLEILEQDFIRDVVTPGKEKNRENLLRNRFPVFAPDQDSTTGSDLQFRYMRYWIEKGHERAELPLDSTQLAAFDTLDRFLSAPRNVVSFRLQKGDILWINNRTVAHNRSSYQDSPGNTRQLQRMWIRARR